VAELGAGAGLNRHLNDQDLHDEDANLGLGAESLRGTETILLVEDEVFVRGVASEILKFAGYGVIAARNAGEACAQTERLAKVDLLLTDVVLPGRSGRVLAHDLRALRPNLAVLFVSGYAGRLAEIASAVPVEEYLAKPFSAVTLLRRVRRSLAKRRLSSEERTQPQRAQGFTGAAEEC
jgi:two-component system cell cycle sensor histidine kinase/response regulator CckA